MLSGLIEGGAALFIAIAGGIFIIGQIRENARKNEKDISDIKEMIVSYQKNMQEMLERNMADVKTLIDTQKDHSRETLNREIAHLKDLISLTNAETRADIQRLEQRQAESNRVKERIALAEASLRSLHKRMDIEPPIQLNRNDED